MIIAHSSTAEVYIDEWFQMIPVATCGQAAGDLSVLHDGYYF